MTESNKEGNIARPEGCRVFLSRCSRAVLPDLTAQLIFWPLMVAGVAADLWSKSAVFNRLQQPGNTIPVIDGFVQLIIAENSGAAFGIAAGQRNLLVAVSIIALVVIFAVFLFSRTEQKLVHIALGLFAAGICGNLYDRVFNAGLVRDFIDVVYWTGHHWPAFNLADTMLCTGVGLLVISILSTEKSSQKHVQQHK